MGQYQDIFQRYEKKYLLNAEQFSALQQVIDKKTVSDSYGESTICNIYFDTPNHFLIRRSLEKPVYKEKLRLRSYGIPGSDDTAFIELKKKYKGIVYKRRISLPYAQAENYLYRRQPPQKENQILKEIDWFLSSYSNIYPAMYLSYRRTALYGKEEPDLRITFDSSILWREENVFLDSGVWGNELLRPGQMLMEIKIGGAMPLWLCHCLDEHQIYPLSFSKYGRAYIQSLSQNKTQKAGVVCA